MRITYLAAGAAGRYCGACQRDVALIRGLLARGHEARMLDLYTPVRTDGGAPPRSCVFFGGVNVCLQQRFAVFRHTPRFVDWVLDRRGLLNAASRFAVETRPEKLGEMTVSMLRGPEGSQRKELARLVRFLDRGPRPEVVNITNSLLSGLAPEIKRRLDVPLVCTLQGEESFLSQLGDPWSDEALALVRENVGAFDLLVSPAEGYADEMSRMLRFPRERIRVVRPGIDLVHYAGPRRALSGEFRIGFLSRVSREKGIDTLVEAYRVMEERRPGGAALSVAGRAAGSDRAMWDELVRGLGGHGRVEFADEVDLAEKVRFLKSCSVFCLPTRIPERRGIACIEAWGAGAPVVVTDIGSLREMVSLAGGGVVVAPDDPHALAGALEALRDDPARASALGEAGAEGAARYFSAELMVDGTLGVYEEALTQRA